MELFILKMINSELHRLTPQMEITFVNGKVIDSGMFRCEMSHVLQNLPIKLFFDAFVYSYLGLYY